MDNPVPSSPRSYESYSVESGKLRVDSGWVDNPVPSPPRSYESCSVESGKLRVDSGWVDNPVPSPPRSYESYYPINPISTIFSVIYTGINHQPGLKKVSIITVNYNQPKITLEFLRSVKEYTLYKNFELIVIDNGSTVDPTSQFSAEHADIHYIRSEENLGFAGGNNLGILKATGDYLFFVNNDTEFTQDIIQKLAETMDSFPAIGMISPKIKYFEHPDLIQYAGFSPMNFKTGRNKCIGQFETDRGQYDHMTGPTSYVHGAAMMVRREAIEKAGLMPENFFLYYEEMDWCETIRRCGYQIWIEPKAVIFHKESVSVGVQSPLKEYFMIRNRILFIRRNAPLLSRIVFYFHFLILVTPRNLLSYFREQRPDLAKQFFKAIWWNITDKKDNNYA